MKTQTKLSAKAQKRLVIGQEFFRRMHILTKEYGIFISLVPGVCESVMRSVLRQKK